MPRNLPLAAYFQLTKPRIAAMTLLMTAFGYYLGGNGFHALPTLLLTLIGTGMVGGGASALNHYMERDVDALMRRTRERPIPSGRISPHGALYFGVILVLGGCFLLLWQVNLLTAFLGLLSAFLYVLVYTPLKRVTWMNTSVGAIPGAIPPLIGWAAATGTVNGAAWIVFAILYIWQHPHFYAIAWIFRDDYRRAGIRMLPTVYPDGKRTFRQLILFSMLLIPVSMLPTAMGMSGWLYATGALLSGLAMLGVGIILSRTKTNADALRMVKASVIYLPLLLLSAVADAAF